MTDTRIAYGARCTWWDTIQNVGVGPHGLPVCPHCKSPLFEYPNEEAWLGPANDYERDGHPGYLKMLMWARGRCFPSLQEMQDAYKGVGKL